MGQIFFSFWGPRLADLEESWPLGHMSCRQRSRRTLLCVYSVISDVRGALQLPHKAGAAALRVTPSNKVLLAGHQLPGVLVEASLGRPHPVWLLLRRPRVGPGASLLPDPLRVIES